MKKQMTMIVSRNGIGVHYTCYHLPDYGRRCKERDDGAICMKCKYCKAEMSAFDATRLLNRADDKVWEDIKAGKGIAKETV